MAEDYLTDDEQLEEVKRYVREYAPVLIIGALLGAGGLFGWRYYQSYQTERGLKAAGQFALLSAALPGVNTKPQLGSEISLGQRLPKSRANPLGGCVRMLSWFCENTLWKIRLWKIPKPPRTTDVPEGPVSFSSQEFFIVGLHAKPKRGSKLL